MNTKQSKPRRKGYKQNMVDVTQLDSVPEEVIENAIKTMRPAYNLKYTPQRAISLFSQALSIAQNEEVHSISTLAVKQHVYRDIYSQLLKRYSEMDTEIGRQTAEKLSHIKKQIEAIIETRLVEGGLINGNNKNPIFAMFLLKCKHNYVEKQSIDISNSDGSMALPRLSAAEINQIRNKIIDNI